MSGGKKKRIGSIDYGGKRLRKRRNREIKRGRGGCNLVAEIVSPVGPSAEIVSRIRGIVQEIFMKIYIK